MARVRFQEKSRELHPDSACGEADAFAVLNEAHATLSRPGTRLRHLMVLEFGSAAADAMKDGGMGEELLELFGRVGEVVVKADAFLARSAKAESALAKALLTSEEREVQLALMNAGGEVGRFVKAAEERLPEIDALLADAREAALELAGVLYRDLSFAEKWQGQLQERMGALIQ